MDELEKIIPVGKENAVHLKELADSLGVSSGAVKKMVQKARQENNVEILSGSRGYYFPKDDDERKEFVSAITKQALTRLNTVKPIKSTLNEFKGQMTLLDMLGAVSEGE